METTTSLPYDPSSAVSIFEYSKGLLGKTLREFVNEDYQAKSGKGGLGQMVEEAYFFIVNNNRREPDFALAKTELKCTPLHRKLSQYVVKERLLCGMINYCEDVDKDFEHSEFYLKCQLMIIIFYLHEVGKEKLDLQFVFSVLWKLNEKDLQIIKHDYEVIVGKIKRGEAHLLSEGDTLYLGACRKGQKGESLMAQPYSPIGAPRRAFSLKMSYMRTVLDFVQKSGKNAIANFDIKENQLVTSEELNQGHFEHLILRRFEPFLGVNYQSIAKRLSIDISNNPKSKFAMIANHIASCGEASNVNRCEEFLKAGLTMKTIRVQASGRIKEAMSFENIDYLEVANCDDWYESRLYELYSSRFMFVVFKEQNKGEEDFLLDDVFFWTMPQQDLEDAELYWNHIRENVLNDRISEQYWWKAADRRKFHVRPKAQKSKDLAPAPNGKLAKKFCYWFNNDYVTGIVNQRLTDRNK